MVVVRGQHYKGICFITPDTAQSKSGSGNVLSRSALMISQALYCFVTLMFSGKIIILQALCLVTEFNLLEILLNFLGKNIIIVKTPTLPQRYQAIALFHHGVFFVPVVLMWCALILRPCSSCGTTLLSLFLIFMKIPLTVNRVFFL